MRAIPVILAIALPAIGQVKSFDAYSYSMPSGYSEKSMPTFVQLNRVDSQRGFACQFGLFPAQPAGSSIEQDLETEWKAVIVKNHQFTSTPVTQAIRELGLPENLIRGGSAKVGDATDLFVALVVLRFPGRYVGVQLSMRPAAKVESCQPDLMKLLRSVTLNAAPAPATTSNRIPTGSTPRLYPGMPGWLPSGAGIAIPDPAIVDGKPQGLWWAGAGQADVRIYLPNGIRASSPRLGGPRLYDFEGQRQQPGANGVGSFSVSGGQILERYDGFENRYSFTATKDSFQIGGATFRPLMQISPKELAGSWRGPGLSFDFYPDGTLTYGTDAILNRGRWVLDGYLLQIQPDRNAGWVELVGYTGVFLVRGNAMMQRR